MMADAMPAAPAGAMPMEMQTRALRKNANADFETADQRGVEGRPPADSGSGPGRDAPPPPRTNLAETAFFLPTLVSGSDGIVTIEFTLPDTLTTWQFKGLAHDAALRSGTLVDTCVATKDLMVEPLMPRFLREGDVVQIPVKVSNTSTGRFTGDVSFALADARTGDSRDALIEGPRQQAFDLIGLVQHTIRRSGIALIKDGGRTVLGLQLNHLLCDVIQRLVPGNPLEFTRAALADTHHRIKQALGGIQA